MSSKGFVGGPFQLLIGVVVFGLALVIGAYLFDMILCWKCTEMLGIEATEFREAVTTIGKGDLNSKTRLLVNFDGLGSCVINGGIFLRQVSGGSGSGVRCETFCPEHPNDCWVVITKSTCGLGRTEIDCLDIGGDTTIDNIDDVLDVVTDADDPWEEGAYYFATTKPVEIEKVGATVIEISKPG